jgi:mono/diheme cytochrome c family protein
MNRLLIESVEGRLLTGVVMIVAIMIIIGWVMINEPARMAAFEEQHLARSIERGAELFAANCTTCHGKTGLGIAERAPALNNPQLFGYNYVDTLNSQIATSQRKIADLETALNLITAEREAIFAEVGLAETTEARRNDIVARLEEIDFLIGANTEELAAQKTALETELADSTTTEDRKTRIQTLIAALDGNLPAQITQLNTDLEPLILQRDAVLDSFLDAMVSGYMPELAAKRTDGGLTLTNYINEDSNRLLQIGWAGDLRSYLKTTLIHGRPGSADVWNGQAMVAWSQTAGGPLRNDEIDDMVNYILNWDKGDAWTLEDLNAVEQFAKLHGSAAPAITVETAGTDVAMIMEKIAALETPPDPVRGEAIYTGAQPSEAGRRLGCSGCHLGGAQAPATEETWVNAVNVRINLPQYAGFTPEQYLITSIVLPNDYVVPPYASGVMQQNFGEQMTVKDIADVLAYLQSYAN